MIIDLISNRIMRLRYVVLTDSKRLKDRSDF